jgi:glycosyltransferase involved in cell wall biosynthesis
VTGGSSQAAARGDSDARSPIAVRGADATHSDTEFSPRDARWPLVSVMMPTRGRPELVRVSIAAVVGQTYPGMIECIVVHDQEPLDPSLTQLGTASRRVVVVTNTHTPGLAGSRNAGLDMATGEYVATCDDDDVWHPEKLETQITRLIDEPDLLVVGSGIRLRLPGGKVIDRPGRADRVSYQLLLRNRVKELHSSTLVMRRDAFAKAGRYDEEMPYSHAEDYDWVLRAARVGRVGTVRQPLADVRKDIVSSRQRWYRGGAQNVALALEYLLAKHPDIVASRRGHARVLGQIAFARSTLGQRRTALRYATKAIIRWPASPHPYVALIHIATGIDRHHLLRLARLTRHGMA